MIIFFCLRYYLTNMNVDNYESYKCWNKCNRFIYKISTKLLRLLGDCWISWEGQLEWIYKNYLNVAWHWWNILCCGWDVYVLKMMVIPAILVWELSLCGDELAITFGKNFVIENGILGRVSFTLELHLTNFS